MAVTATVTSTIITITSTGGVEETFDTCVTAINAVTPNTITGAGTSGNPYIITTPSGYRRLTFNSGTIVTMAPDTYLSWGNITSSGQYTIFVNSGAIFNISEGCYIDQSAGTAGIQVYNYTTGAWNVTGTSSKRVTFKGMTRFYMYAYQTCAWTYFDLVDQRLSGSTGFYFTQLNSFAPVISLTNFTITAPTTGFGYGLYFNAGGMYANVIISDFVIDGIQYGVYIAGCSAKIKNGVIKNCSLQGLSVIGGGNVISPAYETAQDDTIFPTGRFQSMAVAENVVFQDNYTSSTNGYQVSNTSNSLLYLKDCTIQNVTYAGTRRGSYSYYSSIILENNNTYTDMGTDRVWAANATFLHVRKFNITVIDGNDEPIKDAVVSWVQASDPSKERWAGTTNEDGKLLSVFGDSPILAEKEETSTGVYQYWSNDTANDLCHNMIVSKKGYDQQQFCYEMIEDKDVTITLVESTGGVVYVQQLLEGEVLNNSVTGSLTEQNLSGVIDVNNLIGVVQDDG